MVSSVHMDQGAISKWKNLERALTEEHVIPPKVRVHRNHSDSSEP